MYFIRKETKKTYFRVRFELVTRGFELVTLIPELLTRNSCFTFSQNMCYYWTDVKIKIYQNKTSLTFSDRSVYYLMMEKDYYV